jgi:hypothetical protein
MEERMILINGSCLCIEERNFSAIKKGTNAAGSELS